MDRFARLPEGCISEILSLTSPIDSIRSSAVSKGFKSAADSDTIWERFLPSDIQDIISRSESPEVYSNYSKKELYFALCDYPLLIDGGRMFVSLMNPSISVDIEILRDCYKSFAMYCFGRYLVACLGGEERTIAFMEREGRASSRMPLLDHGSERGILKHHFPLNYILKPWKLDRWVYQVIKFGIVQYMIINAFTAILAVILEAFNVYCEGQFRLDCGYIYMPVVLNFSQSWALYCLVQFYTITKGELAHINPLAMFLTFKSIVFLTCWQGVFISLFYDLGLFKSQIAQTLQLQSSIQDFIICIEVICFIGLISGLCYAHFLLYGLI